MKERIRAGLEKIVRIEQLETPEEAKQNRAKYLDYLEDHLALPPHILNGFLEAQVNRSDKTYKNWNVDGVHKYHQDNLFAKIIRSGTDIRKIHFGIGPNPKEYIDQWGIPTLENNQKCRVDKHIPPNVDITLANGLIHIPIRKRIEFPLTQSNGWNECELEKESKKSHDTFMSPGVPYTPQRTEREIWFPDSFLH
jgi:hypothetical protein